MRSHGSSLKVVVMLGAGASVSAGIPDFRTPGTGLYDNLEKYGLPYPEAIFDLDFFRQNPAPFYTLCKELWPGRFAPTLAHHFVKLLETRGVLLRCFTQNIDSLEREAGVAEDLVVAAHGNFDQAHVVGTGRAVDPEEVRDAVLQDGEEGWAAMNARHGGLVKPAIVFFGEALPERYHVLSSQDLPACDLLLVMGTSLQVYPFAGLIHDAPPRAPRVLLNRERVGEDVSSLWDGGRRGGFNFDDEEVRRDVFVAGDTDDGVRDLARALGWEEELLALVAADQEKRRAT